MPFFAMDKKRALFLIAIMAYSGSLQAKEQKADAAPLRPEVEYRAGALRDPMEPYLNKEDANPTPKKQEAAAAEPVLPALVIQGVMWGLDDPLAIINNKVVRKDDVIQGVRIIDINKSGVTVFFANRQHVIAVAALSQKQAQAKAETEDVSAKNQAILDRIIKGGGAK